LILRGWFSGIPLVPPRQPLAFISNELGAWQLVRRQIIDDRIAKVLKADDYVSRIYRDHDNREAELFIAYYASQRAGDTMHSPKNCLPGSGWLPVQNDVVNLAPVSATEPLWINRYVIEKQGERALVLYWYQAHKRVIASEYRGKVYLVWDALRLRRTDGALVRVTLPLRRDEEINSATQVGLHFAQTIFGSLSNFIPA